MAKINPVLKQEYVQLYNTCKIKPEHTNEIDNYIDTIIQNKEKYKSVEKESNVPWYVIASIHLLEGSLNFSTHLHNGDPLSAKTVNVPSGRPSGNPPFIWTTSAIDALECDGLSDWTDWSIEGICYCLEKYNGWGYRSYHSEVKSPYLWSFSEHYTKGKYQSDEHFNPNLVSEQCGGIVILKRLEERGLINFNNIIDPSQQVNWLELFRKEVGANNLPTAVFAAMVNDKPFHVVELSNRSTDDLVAFFGKYPNAKTFHIASSGKTIPTPSIPIVLPPNSLPDLTRILRWGDKGNDVKALQEALKLLGFNVGAEDGDFGDQTETAVKAFQFQSGLLADAEVGPITWEKLGGKFVDNPIVSTDPRHIQLATFAANEAAKRLRWNGASSDAEKYLAPLRPIMQQLGHIGNTPVFYNWCAAFVTYCCRKVGIDIPDKPNNFWASIALVESWEYWGKQNGFFYRIGQTKPMRGDIVTFDFSSSDGEFNHIGIVRGYTPGSTVETAEGNASGVSGHFSRSLSVVSGIIRIR
ncbi:MAG: peptidoglycan-binding protein [Desmonostoc vinosum HA7617-LM4]|nr:peptidoglycan-binding protein [Desmonostoc vinosum HA7617-LM4]